MKPLRFGLLGLGYFGRNYVRLLLGAKGVELAAISSRTRETLDSFASIVPKAVVRTTDSAAILENPGIDCVVIATPPSTHFSLAKEALDNGKHVLLEKPMVASLQEAVRLKSAVRKNSGSTFMVGHQYVYNDYVRALKGRLDSNYFGGVRYVLGEHLSSRSRSDIGILWDAGTHHLSMIRYLFNPGKLVEAEASRISLSNDGQDDFTAASLKFGNGLLATLIVSWLGSTKTRRLSIAGRKKTAVFDAVGKKASLKFFPGLNDFSLSGPEVPRIAAGEPLLNELDHFLMCVRTGEAPLTGIDESFAVTEWLDRISKAGRLR